MKPEQITTDELVEWLRSQSKNGMNWGTGRHSISMLDAISARLTELEKELNEAREQLEHALNPIHSCGANCQRDACVMRRELEGKLRTARADAFEEAAVICVKVRFCDAGVAKIFLDKAAAIRKGEL